MTVKPASTQNQARVVTTWQTLRIGVLRALAGFVVSVVFVGQVQGQLHDSLDAYPPRWVLQESDCDARTLEHKHLTDGGIDGRACEFITFFATHGTKTILLYPIEPVQPIDALNASVHVLSARPGIRIGLRVRFPYAKDPSTNRPLTTIIYGSSYTKSGEYEKIGVAAIERKLQLKTIALRQERGIETDLSDPYVDAVAINAYTGPTTTSLRIDNLNVVGMVVVGDQGRPTHAQPTYNRGRAVLKRLSTNSTSPSNNDSDLKLPASTKDGESRRAFPTGEITKVLQHNGEPMSWVRSLGFDAVLLSKPPTAELLRDAVRSRLMVYAPPPTAPDPKIESLLDSVAGWYIGSDLAIDRRRLNQTAATVKRLRTLPDRWKRPIIAAPAESWRDYSALVDGMIDDLPPRCRNIMAGEEIAEMVATQEQMGSRIQHGIGVGSMPAEKLLHQTQMIAASIGAPPANGYRWHSMWLQVLRGLESTPRAILYRSSRSLVSGTELDSARAMALSYVNRMVSMIRPWVTAATPTAPPTIVGAPYRCSRLVTGETELLILTSTATRGSEVLAGDGVAVEIQLPPGESAKNAWRLTHFSAERIPLQSTNLGSRIEIVSPDAAEIIVISSDPSTGSRLASSAARFAKQASLDRWQLTSDLVRRTREDWQAAVGARVTSQQPPSNLLAVAAKTLRDAEPLFRAGDVTASLRMARRADAWALRSQWQLAEALMPDWPNPTSCPPIAAGNMPAQIVWAPLLQENGWGRNRLTTGSLDRPDVLREGTWSFGKRLQGSTSVDVQWIQRRTYNGPGALRATVVSLRNGDLPGGYEGTAAQIVSPPVIIGAGKAYRIDAHVRTLGFGNPHQGVLVYEDVGGQEAGVLVRGASTWKRVRLYRQTDAERPIRVMFEVIGSGEVSIDEVTLRLWEPKPKLDIPMRPIASQPDQASELR